MGLLGFFGIHLKEYYYEREKLVRQVIMWSNNVNKKWLNVGCGRRCYHMRNVVNCDINRPCSCVVRVDLNKSLPFKDKEFSIAFASHVLEHLPDPDKSFNELQRVADHVLCLVPYKNSLIANLNPDHKWIFDNHIIWEKEHLYPRKRIR